MTRSTTGQRNHRKHISPTMDGGLGPVRSAELARATHVVPRASGGVRARVSYGGAVFVAVCALGCVEAVDFDPAEAAPSAPPTAEFDPAGGIVPLPNAVLINPSTGHVNVPASCAEVPGSPAEKLRAVLNQLDGFGTSGLNLVANFSEPVDQASLDGRVALVRLTERGRPVIPPEGPVPVDVLVSSSLEFAADCASTFELPNITIVPREPLRQASTYGVVIAKGVTTEVGADFEPSVTWALVRQKEAPVQFAEGAEASAFPTHNATPFEPVDPEQLASLRGLDLLWRGHAPLLAGIDQLAPLILPGTISSRDDILLAWAFTTETVSNVFDPAVPGSPASAIAATVQPITMQSPAAGTGALISVEQVFALALPGVPCEALGCASIGTIYTASPISVAPSFKSSSYLTGDDCHLVATETGAFDNPLAPTLVCERQLPLLVVVPLAPPPAAGYPVVIFAHGIGRSKEDLFALAGSLASAGFVAVAVDALDHGARAVQISTDAALGCDRGGDDRPCPAQLGPTCAPQCFAPLLSSDLAVTRDHLRQTVLDHLALGKALAACGAPGACGDLRVDPARIGFIGHSLGALIGATSVANSAEISAAMLNVGGANWLQVLTDTDTLAIRCPLVDALIAGGVIDGVAWNLGANPDATCVDNAWKADPAFLQFASAARWILDPVDPINYTAALSGPGAPAVLVSEVVGDSVVPNSATGALATGLGLEPVAAALATSATPEPTPEALAAGSVWIRYENRDADPALMFPGNGFNHGSLLLPAEPSATMVAPSGELGTIRMRVDGLAFLASHLGATP